MELIRNTVSLFARNNNEPSFTINWRQNYEAAASDEVTIEFERGDTNVELSDTFKVENVCKLETIENDRINLRLTQKYPMNLKSYISRPELESQVLETFLSPNNSQMITVLHGMEGNGKTMLARQIVKIAKEKAYFEENIIWINAENENTIIRDLATCFNISNESDQVQENIVKIIKKQLSQIPFLIVFDNVTDYEILWNFFPPNNFKTNMAILITSDRMWNCDKVKNILVSNFNESEFASFIKQIFENATPEEIEFLAEYTDRLPYLANAACSGFVMSRKTNKIDSFQQYFKFDNDMCKRTSQEVIEYQINLLTKESPLAFEMLSLIAFAKSEMLHKTFLLRCMQKLENSSKNTIDREHILETLVNHGFLQQFGSYITIHKIIQGIIRDMLLEQGNLFDILTLIIQNWENTDQWIFDVNLIWSTGSQIIDCSLLEIMVDNQAFASSLMRDNVTEGIRELVDYAKETKSQRDFIHWILTGKSETMLKSSIVWNRTLFTAEFVEHLNLYYEELEGNREKLWIENQIRNYTLLALRLWRRDSLELLFEAFMNRSFYLGQSLIHEGLRKNLQIVKYLISKGVDVNEMDENGRTPLHKAVTWENIEMTEELLKAGSDPNIQDFDGYTSLHLAIYGSNVMILKCLLSYKANPCIKNVWGQTSLDLANEMEYLEAVDAISKSRVKISHRYI